jgi:hypothetical protein
VGLHRFDRMPLPDRRPVRRLAAIALALVAQTAWLAPVAAGSPKPGNADVGGLRRTIHYEDARAHPVIPARPKARSAASASRGANRSSARIVVR